MKIIQTISLNNWTVLWKKILWFISTKLLIKRLILFLFFPVIFSFHCYCIHNRENKECLDNLAEEGWMILCWEKQFRSPLYFYLFLMLCCRIPSLPSGQNLCYIYHVRFWKEPRITYFWHLTRLCEMWQDKLSALWCFGDPAFSILIEIMAQVSCFM